MQEEALEIGAYGRVSGDVQEKQASIETQVAEMERWCRDRGHAIVGYYLDKSIPNWMPFVDRPEGGRLLADARRGRFQMVLVYETGRLARPTHISSPVIHELTQLRIGYRTVAEDYDILTAEGQLQYEMISATQTYSYTKAKKAMKDGKEYWLRKTFLADDGQEYNYWLEGKVPYGYKAIEMHRRLTLIPNRDLIPACQMSEAQIVEAIYDFLTNRRWSTYAIAAWLNTMGIPPHSRLPAGKGHLRECVSSGRWSPQVVCHLIRNTIYYGLHIYGKPEVARRRKPKPGHQRPPERETVERHFPAIISYSLWETAQCRIIENRSLPDRNRQHLYLLSGKLRCACCGSMYTGSLRYGRVQKPQEGVWFYICEGKRNRKATLADRLCEDPQFHCSNRPLREWIEDVVWQKIIGYLRNPGDILRQLVNQMQDRGDHTSRLLEERDHLKNLSDRMLFSERQALEDRADGTLSKDQLRLQLQIIQEKRQALTDQIEALEAQIIVEEQAEGQLQRTTGYLEALQERVADPSVWDWDLKRSCVEIILAGGEVMPPSVPGGQPTVKLLFDFLPDSLVSIRSPGYFSRGLIQEIFSFSLNDTPKAPILS